MVQYRFKDELYKDTIIHGEMIRDNNKKWLYLIDDIYVYSGELLNTMKFEDKIKRMYRIISEEYIPDQYLAICPIKIKHFFNSNQVDEIMDEVIKTLNYVSKGIMLNVNDPKYNNIFYFFKNPLNSQSQQSNKTNN